MGKHEAISVRGTDEAAVKALAARFFALNAKNIQSVEEPSHLMDGSWCIMLHFLSMKVNFPCDADNGG